MSRPPLNRIPLQMEEAQMAGKMSHGERVLLGRIGAYTALSRHSACEMTEPARRAFASKFERDVDPEGVLRGSLRVSHGELALLTSDPPPISAGARPSRTAPRRVRAREP